MAIPAMAPPLGAQPKGGHPWISECWLHEEMPSQDLSVLPVGVRSLYEEQHYLNIALVSGHLYFKPVTVHSKPVQPGTVLKTEQEFHITLVYLPVSPREHKVQ